MRIPSTRHRPVRRVGAALAVTLALAGCGGGGDAGAPSGSGPLSCAVGDQKTWLSSYFNDSYFWYAMSPRPAVDGTSSVDSFFKALLYTGTDPNFPADRWSGYESTESFNRFFGDGQSLGYGLSVAGLEVVGQSSAPLYVRSVDPRSVAAAAGIVRGDTLLSLNGRSTVDLIAANDFSLLSAKAVGDSLEVVWRTTAGVQKRATLSAGIYALTPVPLQAVVTTAGGRRVGYLEVRNMISQAATPLETAFASFAAQGAQDIVLDLRYNGGGLVSMGAAVASYVGGTRVAGRAYASLLYNDKQAAQNQRFDFSNPALGSAANAPRVFVLMGRRTCSASEQVINGLRGAGIEVVAIGEASCGKPVGFLPQSDGCGTTYSIVNFESVNALNQGRYFSGFAPTCAVAEDWTQPQASVGDPLWVAASRMVDGGACPTAGMRVQPAGVRAGLRSGEGGERQGMIPR